MSSYSTQILGAATFGAACHGLAAVTPPPPLTLGRPSFHGRFHRQGPQTASPLAARVAR